MAEPNIARPRGSIPYARRKGFGAFCALVVALILALLINPFAASAKRPARDRDAPGHA
jgi:hypothetical protein